MKKQWSLLMLVIVAAACEMVVDIDVPIEREKLVVNSLFHPDSGWLVMVARSRYILDDLPPFPISNALVTITDDTDQQMISLEPVPYLGGAPTEGQYFSVSKPEHGRQYTLQVETAIGTATSTSAVPAPVPILRIRMDSSNFESEIPTRITFKDPPGEANFYEIRAMAEVLQRRFNPATQQVTLDTTWNYLRFDIKDQSIIQEGFQRRFNDVRFDGDEFTLHAELSNFWFHREILRIRIILIHLSRDHYMYATTVQLQERTNFDPLSQPVQVFNNIENGLGIFGGSSNSAVEFVVK